MRSLSLMAIAGTVALLAGCGAPVGAPSLNLRPIEQQPVPLPVAVAAEPEVAEDTALTSMLASHIGAAEASDRAFQGARSGAERAVAAARGAPVGSEAWTAAQEAISALEVARGPVRDAALAIESLQQEPANAGTGARAAIARAADRIAALQTAETAAIASLSARLR